jgi:hypothetical protein
VFLSQKTGFLGFMQKEIDYFETIGFLANQLEKKGLSPVLVGGMALVLLVSQRVTVDFDFLISAKNILISDLVYIFYKQGFELITKLNKQGEVVRTIDNKNIAAIRLKIDDPASALFYNGETELRIDLLFDFPLLATEVADRATKVKVKSHSLLVASPDDLTRMKEIAYADRKKSSDAHDLEFLRELKKKV